VPVRRRPLAGRMMAQFLIDLAVSVSVVLAFGWFFQASASDLYLREALVTQNEVYVALGRFTPTNLLTAYGTNIYHMTRSLIFGFDPADGFLGAAVQAFVTIGQIMMDIGLAAPGTMLELYHQTSGLAAQIVLAGFATTIGSVFALLLTSRLSLPRLLLALALSPIAVSVAFLVLQGFMVVMLEAFVWFTALAPYAVACPVICTLYWVIFPNADRGATVMLLRAIGRVIELPRR
jgi:hypothetical protein